MNNTRREQLKEIMEKVILLKDNLYDIRCDIESVKDDERESYDNIPESLLETEKAYKSQECIDNMDEIDYKFDYIDDYLDEVISCIEECIE